jgi:HEAT repeat protein
MTPRFSPLLLLGCLVPLLAPAPAAGAFDKVIDSVMYQEPAVPMPRIVSYFPEGATALWVRALQRPEADPKCQAARAIARARRRGVKGLEVTIDPLLKALDQPDQHPAVRLAVAEALIELDARKAAPSLFRHAREGDTDLQNLIEPALARWDHRPARAVWLERLANPGTPRRSLLLAMRGLGTVREEKAVEPLRERALSEGVPVPVRLEAARALGSVRGEGLKKDAGRLAGGTASDRLCAASLLARHDSPEAVGILQRLVRDKEPAVTELAAGRLLAIDPKLVEPALDHLLASPDGNVRAIGVEVLFRLPDAKHLRLLGDRLDDQHTGVRKKAREALHALAGKKELRTPVIAEGMRVLAGADWRGQEQSAILLTQLGHKPAGVRLVALLEASRPEVFLTAAWALRKLGAPETCAPVTRYARNLVKNPKAHPGAEEGPPGLLDHQLSQLHQFLGRMKYRPAEALLRGSVPKGRGLGPESRAAAIWALGWIHEGEAVPGLVKALEGRLNDLNPIEPEDDRVRRMSAVALGQMKAKDAEASLRRYFDPDRADRDFVGNACRWAVGRITGKPFPPPAPIRRVEPGDFLLPSP